MTVRVAVVEDDPEAADLLHALLSRHGFEVARYPTPGRFFDGILRSSPAIALVDMRLPGMDGKDVIRILRSNPQTRGILVIAMTAEQRHTQDVVQGLHAGADEYLLKPLDSDLLLARIESLLRRGGPAPEACRSFAVGPLLVDPGRREARLDGREVRLTRLEFDLLVYMLGNPNRVLTRRLIMDMVWKAEPGMETRTVDKHVESIRRKLPPLGSRIETVVKVGYMLRLP